MTADLVGQRLASAEAVIEKGLGTFVEVGAALMSIRDERLYRVEYGTFEDYCRERWGFSRSRAHRLIEAAEVVEMLPIGNTPTTESQARELTGLDPETAAEVMQAAAESGKVTAATIRDARDAITKPAHVTTTTRITEATKVEQDVDPDTGEILDDGPSRAGRAAANSAYVPNLNALPEDIDPPAERAAVEFHKSALNAFARIQSTTQLPAERCAELSDQVLDEVIEGFDRSWSKWITEYRAARPRGLRLVKGQG